MTPHPPEPDSHIKDWRAFGDREWKHVSEGAQGLALGSAVPAVIFYLLYRFWEFLPAVLAVLTWSAAVFWLHRRRTRHADVFSATTFAFACVSATVGVVTQDPVLYLAAPSFENLVYGLIFLGTALAGRPLLGQFARRLYPIPPRVEHAPEFRRAILFTSLVWFIGLAGRAVVRLWLISLWVADVLTLELYLVLNTVSGWPFNLGLVAFTVWYPVRAMKRAGLMESPPIAAIADVEASVEEATPGVP